MAKNGKEWLGNLKGGKSEKIPDGMDRKVTAEEQLAAKLNAVIDENVALRQENTALRRENVALRAKIDDFELPAIRDGNAAILAEHKIEPGSVMKRDSDGQWWWQKKPEAAQEPAAATK